MKYWVILFVVYCTGLSIQAQTFTIGFENHEPDEFFRLVYPAYSSDAFSGRQISKVPSGIEYSHLFEYRFPDSLEGRNLEVSISVWYRFPDSAVSCSFVTDLSNGDKNLLWRADSLSRSNIRPGWKKFVAFVKLPADMTRDGVLKIYLWNRTLQALELDELTIRLEVLKMPTFIPDLKIPRIKGSPRVLAQHGIFELLYFGRSSLVALADRKGRLLTGPIGIVSVKNDSRLKHFNAKWRVYAQYDSPEGTRTTVLKNRTSFFRNTLTITTRDNTGRIEIDLSSTSAVRIVLERHSLVVPFAEDLTEIYRTNGRCDTADFQPAYYLADGGVTAGKGESSVHVYKTGVSSVQLDTQAKLMLLNIDYKADHPQLHYPLANNKQDYYHDMSAKEYTRGESLEKRFVLFAGQDMRPTLRLMPYPFGYESVVIWSEHADYTDLRTHRAVHFGHEDIVEPEDAVGGFAAFGIPVTKSVFYHNPDSVTNAETSEGLFPGKHASIDGNNEFIDFLKKLHNTGNEVCLHSPGQFTDSREEVIKALGFMQTAFGSPTWIDHGYNNHKKFNRENAVCDGFNKKSEFYVADLWKAHGVKYFWNPFYEEVRPFEDWMLGGHFVIPYPGFGDAFPYVGVSPVNYHKEAWHWATSGTLEVPEDRLWDYYFSDDHLEALIKHRSLWINHVYPAWARYGKGFWTFDDQSKVVVMPGLNRALEKLDTYRKQGKILVMTVGNYLDYVTSVQNLQLERNPDGTVTVHNPHNIPVEGLCFVIHSDQVLVNGIVPASRNSDNETIFWFDLPAHSSAVISY